tara:strand:- start:1038 stop:2063 length:1026 start_codon:yes stop_codon:yes gene_type:complete
MKDFQKKCEKLKKNPKTWLVTGVAGFIGSNILEKLLQLNQNVIGLDNLSTGYMHNLDEVKLYVSESQWSKFSFVNGDISHIDDCKNVTKGVDHVLHQAALGSVPRSIENPIQTNKSNIDGFLNILVAAKDANVTSFTYAASSSTYGDHKDLPKVENKIGNPLSPYAITKYVNELYAEIFSKCYNFHSIGLRYFNVFGKRQDPNGAYAAVIPKWVNSMIANEQVFINGDGKTSRDFCYVENVVQANILSALSQKKSKNNVYNIAFGERTTLINLFNSLKDELTKNQKDYILEPKYNDFREGDVRHSLADISKAKNMLSYEPSHSLLDGIGEIIPWYINNLNR